MPKWSYLNDVNLVECSVRCEWLAIFKWFYSSTFFFFLFLVDVSLEGLFPLLYGLTTAIFAFREVVHSLQCNKHSNIVFNYTMISHNLTSLIVFLFLPPFWLSLRTFNLYSHHLLYRHCEALSRLLLSAFVLPVSIRPFVIFCVIHCIACPSLNKEENVLLNALYQIFNHGHFFSFLIKVGILIKKKNNSKQAPISQKHNILRPPMKALSGVGSYGECLVQSRMGYTLRKACTNFELKRRWIFKLVSACLSSFILPLTWQIL